MAPQQAPIIPPRERLTWQEICARYPDQWVEMTDFEWEGADEDNGELLSAVVLAHAKSRKEALRASKEIRQREGIQDGWCRFTGPEIPEGFVSLRQLGL